MSEIYRARMLVWRTGFVPSLTEVEIELQRPGQFVAGEQQIDRVIVQVAGLAEVPRVGTMLEVTISEPDE